MSNLKWIKRLAYAATVVPLDEAIMAEDGYPVKSEKWATNKHWILPLDDLQQSFPEFEAVEASGEVAALMDKFVSEAKLTEACGTLEGFCKVGDFTYALLTVGVERYRINANYLLLAALATGFDSIHPTVTEGVIDNTKPWIFARDGQVRGLIMSLIF